MDNALDAFRAQQAAVEELRVRLAAVAVMLREMHKDADAIAHNRELHAVLSQHEHVIARTEQTIAELRRWQEQERLQYWPAIVRRWIVALGFELASAWVAGVGYAWRAAPSIAERAAQQAREDLGAVVEQRVHAMRRSERRQFDVLMKWNQPTK